MPDLTNPMAHHLCYRYQAWAHDWDVEAVWALVQGWGGFISIRNDCIDFWVPREQRLLFELAYPDLCRQPELDYV